jgi:hypothetical protein
MKGNIIDLGTKLYAVNRDNKHSGIVESRFNVYECVLITKIGEFYLWQFSRNNFGNVNEQICQNDYEKFFNIVRKRKEVKNSTFSTILENNKTKLGYYYTTLNSIFYFSETNEIEESFINVSFDFNNLKEEVNELLNNEIKDLEYKELQIKQRIINIKKQLKENGG